MHFESNIDCHLNAIANLAISWVNVRKILFGRFNKPVYACDIRRLSVRHMKARKKT